MTQWLIEEAVFLRLDLQETARLKALTDDHERGVRLHEKALAAVTAASRGRR